MHNTNIARELLYELKYNASLSKNKKEYVTNCIQQCILDYLEKYCNAFESNKWEEEIIEEHINKYFDTGDLLKCIITDSIVEVAISFYTDFKIATFTIPTNYNTDIQSNKVNVIEGLNYIDLIPLNYFEFDEVIDDNYTPAGVLSGGTEEYKLFTSFSLAFECYNKVIYKEQGSDNELHSVLNAVNTQLKNGVKNGIIYNYSEYEKMIYLIKNIDEEFYSFSSPVSIQYINLVIIIHNIVNEMHRFYTYCRYSEGISEYDLQYLRELINENSDNTINNLHI